MLVPRRAIIYIYIYLSPTTSCLSCKRGMVRGLGFVVVCSIQADKVRVTVDLVNI